METLLEQLLEQWQQEFDEISTISYYKAQVKTTLYAEGLRYDLKKFDWNNFPSDGPLTKDKSGLKGGTVYEYGFNAQGLPCYVAFGDNWEGFYTYSDSMVKYVEFCLITQVPSALIQIGFEEGKKISMQRLTINGRGGRYSRSNMSKDEIVSKIRNDKFSLIATATHYIYGITGIIEKASSIHISPGFGKFTSYDEYTYDNNQVLDTIRTFYEQGTDRLTYCRIPEDLSPELLVENLAAAMATLIVETLSNKQPGKPIALLELNYHYADNYNPLLVCQTSQDVENKIAKGQFAFISDYSDSLSVEIKPVEHLFAQLEQMMEDDINMNLGRDMLRKSAYILTRNKLSGKLNVTEDFAAYAIDWSIEGHSDAYFEEILKECGLETKIIEKWKQRGILAK